MAISVVMPALEMAQETGKLVSWRKKEGERVAKGEILLEIETDKAVVEIESPGDGVLSAITAHEGAVIPVGQTIAWLLQAGEHVPADQAKTPSGRRSATESMETAAGITGDSTRVADAGGAVRVSPKARRLAQEHGVDLATVQGSGPGGEILADDIVAASRPQGAGVHVPADMSTAARLMAERTTASWTTVPHFFLTREVEATALNAAHASRPGTTHTDLLVALVARALAAHPRMNASWVDGAIRPNVDINVAIAMAAADAVVSAVVPRADRLPIADLAARRQELTGRARAGRLQPADIAGATFTISNLGMHHVDAFTAIIVPPQAGILAVGAIRDRVVAIDGQPAVRPMLTLTLSCDHRVVDGARAAAFLHDVVEAIHVCEALL